TEPVEVPATGSVEPLVFTDRSPTFNNEDSCLSIGHSVLIQQAAGCGLEPPGAAVIRMRAIGEGLEVLRLEDSLGRSVFTQVAPVSGTPYETEIDFDTEGLADGVHSYVLSASNSVGRTRSFEVSLPVDRTPPTVTFSAPDDGALVCAQIRSCPVDDFGTFKNDVPTLFLESQVEESFPGTLTSEAREKLFSRTPSGNDNGLRPLFGSSGINLPIDRDCMPDPLPTLLADETGFGPGFSFTKKLKSAPGLLDANAEIAVAGLGGHLVCVEQNFQVDAEVESVAPFGRRYFSPNGDGAFDSVTYGLTAPSEPITVDVEVFDDVEYVLPPLIGGFGGAIAPTGCIIDPQASPTVELGNALPVPGTSEVAWDGLTSGGSSLPDGLYGIRFTSRDGCGNRTVEDVCVDLDTVPPVLSIDSPQAGVDLPTVITIRLTAFDPGENPYGSIVEPRELIVELSYGVGAEPTAFFPIDGTVWNTFGLDAGPYTLRAVARDAAGNSTEERLLLNLNPGDLITYLEAAPDLFSPGQDGVLDETAARFGLDRDASVTVRVEGPGVAVTLIDEPRSRGAQVVAWDGTDETGELVPDGEYLLVVDASAVVDGGTLEQIERVGVVVDQTPPEQVVERPQVEGFLKLEDVVRASVTDVHLEEWILSVAPNDGGAAAWQELGRGSVAIASVTTDLAEGSWRVRLESSDQAGNRSETIVPFKVDASAPTAEWT
ncbi:MAG: hypothetical protein AAFY88_13090, partial [Acidobacteriota bacterium]